jgi:hypothetical protein
VSETNQLQIINIDKPGITGVRLGPDDQWNLLFWDQDSGEWHDADAQTPKEALDKVSKKFSSHRLAEVTAVLKQHCSGNNIEYGEP